MGQFLEMGFKVSPLGDTALKFHGNTKIGMPKKYGQFLKMGFKVSPLGDTALKFHENTK